MLTFVPVHTKQVIHKDAEIVVGIDDSNIWTDSICVLGAGHENSSWVSRLENYRVRIVGRLDAHNVQARRVWKRRVNRIEPKARLTQLKRNK